MFHELKFGQFGLGLDASTQLLVGLSCSRPLAVQGGVGGSPAVLRVRVPASQTVTQVLCPDPDAPLV